jgi:hypothetical protein
VTYTAYHGGRELSIRSGFVSARAYQATGWDRRNGREVWAEVGPLIFA